ncbi:MAG: Ig-like domain-containing protein [Gemmatimonadota bacterium]
MLRDLLSRHAFRLWLALALGALPAALAGCDEPTRPEPVAAVDLTVPTTRLAVGQSIQLAAAVRSAAGQVLAGRRVVWSSSNEAVATVDEGGRVTGRAPGPVTITAAAGGKQEGVELVVEPAVAPPGPVARVTMEPDSFLLVVGNTVTIQSPTENHLANARARVLAVPRDAAGAVLLWHPVRFSTSDAAVATVSDSGVVRAVAPGTAVVTAQVGAVEGRLVVTVERPWTTTYLGTLPGMPESSASGINEQGQVVGVSAGGPTPGATRGWIWRNGTLTELVVPGKTAVSVAPGAINDRGQVGGIVSASDGLFVALWENGQPTLAPAIGGAFGGMNERGEIVGSWRSGFCTRNCPAAPGSSATARSARSAARASCASSPRRSTMPGRSPGLPSRRSRAAWSPPARSSWRAPARRSRCSPPAPSPARRTTSATAAWWWGRTTRPTATGPSPGRAAAPPCTWSGWGAAASPSPRT